MYTYLVTNVISQSELAKLKVIFKAIDTDNNGWLSLEELKEGYCKHMGVWLPEE